MIVNRNKEVAGGTVVVRWEHNLELACPVVGYNISYREVFSPADKSKWNLFPVNINATNHTLYLRCGKEYELVVTSLIGPRGNSMVNSRIWNFKTGGGISQPVFGS